MRSGLEQQRGNRIYELEFKPALKLVHSSVVTDVSGWLRGLKGCNDKLMLNKIGYIALVDAKSRDLLWEIKEVGLTCQDMSYENELYLLTECEALARRDADTGEVLWEAELQGEIEAIKLVSARSVFTSTSDDEHNLLHARSKADGQILWTQRDTGYGSFATTLCENGIVVTKNKLGFRALIEETGEQLWAVRFNDWLSENLPHTDPERGVTLELFVDGVFYLRMFTGYIAAIRADNCEVQWIHKVENPESLPQSEYLRNPGTLIHRNGELLFNIAQGSGESNFLTILDSSNGGNALPDRRQYYAAWMHKPCCDWRLFYRWERATFGSIRH